MIERRQFLKTAPAWVGGAGMGLINTNLKGQRKGQDKVELAIASICLDGFGDLNFEKTFEVVPKTGIKNVEFNVWYSRTVTPIGIQSIRDRCYKYGLRPISLQGSAFGGDLLKDVTHKLWLMEQATKLGCRRVKFTGKKRGEGGGLNRVIEVLKELAPAAEDLDVLICVENHANNNIENIEDYKEIFNAVDSSHMGMCLDMGHFEGAGIHSMEVVDTFFEKINHVDIKDTVSFGEYKTVPFGQGVNNGEEIVEDLIRRGYSGYLVIEQAPPFEEVDLVKEMDRIKNIFSRFETSN